MARPMRKRWCRSISSRGAPDQRRSVISMTKKAASCMPDRRSASGRKAGRRGISPMAPAAKWRAPKAARAPRPSTSAPSTAVGQSECPRCQKEGVPRSWLNHRREVGEGPLEHAVVPPGTGRGRLRPSAIRLAASGGPHRAEQADIVTGPASARPPLEGGPCGDVEQPSEEPLHFRKVGPAETRPLVQIQVPPDLDHERGNPQVPRCPTSSRGKCSSAASSNSS